MLTGGPPFAALADACLGDPKYTYPNPILRIFDRLYGFIGAGPCLMHDQSWKQTWDETSLEGAGFYDYPDTRILGELGAGGPGNTDPI